MPCNDWGNSRCDGTCNNHEVKRLQERNDLLARMLCGLCNQATPGMRDIVPGLREWWKEHQEHDRKREAQEKEERQKRAERQARIAARQEKRERELLVQLAGKFGKRII